MDCRSMHSAVDSSRISQITKSWASTIMVPPKPIPCFLFVEAKRDTKPQIHKVHDE